MCQCPNLVVVALRKGGNDVETEDLLVGGVVGHSHAEVDADGPALAVDSITFVLLNERVLHGVQEGRWRLLSDSGARLDRAQERCPRP